MSDSPGLRWMVGVRDRGPSHIVLTGPIEVHPGERPETVARALGEQGDELAYLFRGPQPPVLQDLVERVQAGRSIVALDTVELMYSMLQQGDARER